nr:MAG TPA: hypothetical protein [Caudoviricetes sp.]
MVGLLHQSAAVWAVLFLNTPITSATQRTRIYFILNQTVPFTYAFAYFWNPSPMPHLRNVGGGYIINAVHGIFFTQQFRVVDTDCPRKNFNLGNRPLDVLLHSSTAHFFIFSYSSSIFLFHPLSFQKVRIPKTIHSTAAIIVKISAILLPSNLLQLFICQRPVIRKKPSSEQRFGHARHSHLLPLLVSFTLNGQLWLKQSVILLPP